MTGTCTVYTCTRYLPIEFKDIATTIFQSYKKALQVNLVDAGKGRKELVIKNQKQGGKNKKLEATDMVYLGRSRDFCLPDNNGDLPGTKGRKCGHKYTENFRRKTQVNTTTINECHHLCCGRGYTISVNEESEKCGCKFDMKIMNVKCKECSAKKETYFCR